MHIDDMDDGAQFMQGPQGTPSLDALLDAKQKEQCRTHQHGQVGRCLDALQHTVDAIGTRAREVDQR